VAAIWRNVAQGPFARHGSGRREAPGEFQQLALLRVVKPIDLFDRMQ
jgi:hypothetical protein